MKKWLAKFLTDDFKTELKSVIISGVITAFLLGGAILSLVVAILATQVGEHRTAEVLYILSLVLVMAGGVYAIPRLMKRIRWNFLQFNISYTATPGTAFFMAILVVVGLAAFNTGNNLLYLIFSVLLGLILTSGVVSETGLRELDIGLRFPDHIFAGQDVLLEISVTNHKFLIPSFSLSVGVELSNQPVPTGMEKVRQWLLGSTLAGELSKLTHFIVVPSHQRLRQTIQHSFSRRGRYEIKGFTVSTQFPFGFIQKTRRIEAQGELIVYPELEKRRDLLSGLSQLMGTQEHFFKGTGVDLYAIRQYQSGDNLRHIDWKATAKVRRTMVKEFAREDERRISIYFDNRAPKEITPEFLNAFEAAVKRAASIAAQLVESNIQVRLLTPIGQTDFGESKEHLFNMLRTLALIAPESPDELPTTDPQASAAKQDFFKLVSSSNEVGILFTGLPPAGDQLSRFQRFGKIIQFQSLVN